MPAAPVASPSAPPSSCCPGMTRSGLPSRSRSWTSCAAGVACSVSGAARRASNTPGSAYRWRRRGRVLSRQPRSSSRRSVKTASSTRARSTASHAPRSGRARSRIPSGASTPRPPIILTNVCCAESRDEAHERAFKYLGQKWQSIDDHYHFSDGHLATVKGYESYGKMARTYAKIGESAETRQKATDFYVSIQIVGTPNDCLDKIGELQRLTGLDHLVTEYSFGAMPHEEAEVNMRLFADRVLPVLQRDPAFVGGKLPEGASVPAAAAKENLFAPA